MTITRDKLTNAVQDKSLGSSAGDSPEENRQDVLNVTEVHIGANMHEDDYERAEQARNGLRLLQDMAGAISGQITLNPADLHSMLCLIEEPLSRGLEAVEWKQFQKG